MTSARLWHDIRAIVSVPITASFYAKFGIHPGPLFAGSDLIRIARS
jgi:hypothetical protein